MTTTGSKTIRLGPARRTGAILYTLCASTLCVLAWSPAALAGSPGQTKTAPTYVYPPEIDAPIAPAHAPPMMPMPPRHAMLPSHDTSMIDVELNQTQVVRLPLPASAVVIGNPGVADVSVHASDVLLLVGRGYGRTNLIVLDAAGNTVMDRMVRVKNSMQSGDVRLFNGSGRQTYSCAPDCQAAPVLGDDTEFRGINTDAAAPISNPVAVGATVTPQVQTAPGSPPDLGIRDFVPDQ